jgi:hypothetical protein
MFDVWLVRVPDNESALAEMLRDRFALVGIVDCQRIVYVCLLLRGRGDLRQ